jgi:DNA-binding transcriptional LysR family regulator
MDRIAGMQAFMALVEAGSFHAAARQLGLSRALVSKRVAALERELGVSLVQRTTRALSVTGPGAEFLEPCRQVLEAYEAATAGLARHQAEPRGLLRVNGPMSFGQLHLAPAVLDFAGGHPDIGIQLTLTDRFVDPIEEGFDLVVRIGAPRASSLVARRLGTVRRVLCASPGYLGAAGTPATPEDLQRHKVLHYGWQATGSRWHLLGPEGEVVLDLPRGFCANNGEVLRMAALADRGIGLLPTFIVGPALRDGRLARVLEAWEAPPIVLHALWPQSRLLPARTRAFIDFLVERFAGDPPPWESGRSSPP